MILLWSLLYTCDMLTSVLLQFIAIPSGQIYLTELSPEGIGQTSVTFSSPALNAPALPLTGYHVETGYFTTNSGTARNTLYTDWALHTH